MRAIRDQDAVRRSQYGPRLEGQQARDDPGRRRQQDEPTRHGVAQLDEGLGCGAVWPAVAEGEGDGTNDRSSGTGPSENTDQVP